jgi:hypothetical protein
MVEFSVVDGDYFRVSVVARDHSATRLVDASPTAHPDCAGLARLFAEAGQEWKGWDGTKVWESREGELRLELSIDRLGHVTAAVRVRHDNGRPDRWQLEAELGLDAGQLSGIAREAAGLWPGGD